MVIFQNKACANDSQQYRIPDVSQQRTQKLIPNAHNLLASSKKNSETVNSCLNTNKDISQNTSSLFCITNNLEELLIISICYFLSY